MPAKPHKKTPFLESLNNAQLLMTQGGEQLFQASIEHIEASEHADRLLAANDNPRAAANDDDFWGVDGDENDWRNYYRPYKVIDGVLQIPVMGVLLDKFSFQFGRWATGYKYIEKALQRGLADPNVRAIALVCDSPGGEVSGCFELADKLYDARSEKPIRAFAANHAYSAAYALASAANDIVVTRSGGVGSIGVVTMHISYADALAKAGIKVTFIESDPSKTEGNRFEDLSKAAKDRIQKRINKIYGVFSSTVAKHRGIEEETVVDLKAYTYDADEALENGLADRMGALEEELVIFTEEVNETGDEFMATPAQGNVTGKAPLNSGEGIDQATYDKGVSDARAEGVAEGMSAQKTRISAILESDAGKKRPSAALAAALEGDMSAEATIKFLSKLPEEAPAKQTPAATTEGNDQQPQANGGKDKTRNHFAEHMNSSQQPNVGGGEDEDEGDDTAKAVSNILGAYGAETGGKTSGRRSPFARAVRSA